MPLTLRLPEAVSSPVTLRLLPATAAARITRVLALLAPSTELPWTVSPPERVRLVAVRLLCSRTGAVKFATELTVRRLSLLFPMVVLLPWAAKAAVMVVGELMVRAMLVPEEPMMMAPAGTGYFSLYELKSCPPGQCTPATSLHGKIMQACSMPAQLCACCGQSCMSGKGSLHMVPGRSVSGTADLPVKVVGAFMRRALAVPACPIWTVEYTVKTAPLPEPLPKVLAPACGSQGVQLLSFRHAIANLA